MTCCAAAIKAVRKLGIIHRDLSVGNVMFRVNDAGQIEGILNDWDHCGPASLRPDDPQINVVRIPNIFPQPPRADEPTENYL